MNLSEAKKELEEHGYIVEDAGAKTDDNFLNAMRRQRAAREGITTNKPNSNIPQHMISYYAKKSEICDNIVKGLNDVIEYISENGDDDGRFEYIIKQLINLRNKGNIPMPK